MLRKVALFGTAAMVVSLLVVVPALGNSHEDAVRLHLGSDGRSFSYDGVTQSLTVARNGCQINSPEPLIDLSATNGGSPLPPGLNALGIGVKSSGSNSNGTPCGQTDSTETLHLARTGSTLAGRAFNKVRLDVEMTGNAVVKVSFFAGSSTTPTTATLQTGTSITADQSDDPLYDTSAPYEVTTADFVSDTNQEADGDLTDACAAPNSSGPNNAGNDNCLWTIDPGMVFDRISITTTIGTASLEGSGDFDNDTDHDSLFFLANAAPVAVDDSAVTDEDTAIAIDVLTNDSDADGDPIQVSSVDSSSTGTASVSGGVVTYDPNGQFETLGTDESATDSFGYTIQDGNGATTSATVTVTVTGVNDAPVPAGPATVVEDSTTVITIATDVDSDTIITECTSEAGGQVSGSSNGTVTYTPPADFDDSDTLTCTVDDTEVTVEIVVTVDVTPDNDAPVAVDDEAFLDYTDYEDNTAPDPVTIDVLANDTDAETPSGLTIEGVDTTDIVVDGSPVDTQGTVSVAGDGKSVLYTPPMDFTGRDSFEYTVSDGSLTDTARVDVYELFECGETLTVEEGGTSAAYKRLGVEPDCGEGKPYFVDIITTDDGATTPTEELPTVIFQPRSQTGDTVLDCSDWGTLATPEPVCTDEFAATISFGPRPEANAPDTGDLQYDPVNREPADYNTSTNFRAMEWCEIDDFDPFADAGNYSSSEILPSGESWCIASVSTSSASDTETLTTWILYGIGDPAKRI